LRGREERLLEFRFLFLKEQGTKREKQGVIERERGEVN